jgi:hypothetical protein
MSEDIPFKERPLLLRWWDDGSTHLLTRFLVLRLLGVVYFVAFASAFAQGPALIGEHGLLPMEGHVGVPSIFLLSSSDAMLRATTLIGAGLALAVVLGVTNAGVMLVLWFLQLSLCKAGQIFWGYGWEIQLCETGMIAVFMCPMRTWRPFASAPPLLSIWMMRWLVVRIMLGAGLIKIRGDACWRDLTCLVFHYETQPNPSPVSWLLHQAPPWVHTIGVLFNHFVELAAPMLVFGPRKTRRIAGVCFVVFQIILIISGNLSFLNWLTIVPALACFDDEMLSKKKRVEQAPSSLHVKLTRAYAVIVAALSFGPIINMLSTQQSMNASFEPLHLVNTYGAFGTVTRIRNEIVLEGTRDGEHWLEYELPCKPGDVLRRPCLVTPYHYRLDWQMWFAAMSSYEEEPWIAALVDKLLRGDDAVDPLFAKNPFPDAPPMKIRAELYRYSLTRFGSGPAWWTRQRVGEYMRPLTKDDPELESFLRDYGLYRR